MMRYALVNVADKTWASGPFDAEPDVPEGQQRILVPFNFPEKCYWSPAADGFVDIVPPAKIAILDYLLLFTPQEFMAIKAQRAVNPTIDYLWSLLEVATNGIWLDDPLIATGLGVLEEAGLITAERVASVLAGVRPA